MTSGEANAAPLSPCIPVPNGIPNAMKGLQWWPGHCCAAEVTAMELRPLLFQELDLFKALPKRGWFPPPGCMHERESTNNSLPSKKGSVSPGQPISGVWAAWQIEPVYLWLWEQRVTKPKSKFREAGCTIREVGPLLGSHKQWGVSKKLDLCPEQTAGYLGTPVQQEKLLAAPRRCREPVPWGWVPAFPINTGPW